MNDRFIYYCGKAAGYTLDQMAQMWPRWWARFSAASAERIEQITGVKAG